MPIVAGNKTRVILREDKTLTVITNDQGHELKEGERDISSNIRALDISIRLDEIVTADAQMFINPEHVSFVIKEHEYQLFAGLPEYKWEPKRIAKIQFADGMHWEDEEIIYGG